MPQTTQQPSYLYSNALRCLPVLTEVCIMVDIWLPALLKFPKVALLNKQGLSGTPAVIQRARSAPSTRAGAWGTKHYCSFTHTPPNLDMCQAPSQWFLLFLFPLITSIPLLPVLLILLFPLFLLFHSLTPPAPFQSFVNCVWRNRN